MFSDSCLTEQLSLCSQKLIVGPVEDSVLQTEMTGFESQEEDSPKRILFFKPMSWLGQISPHRRDESWSASLWQTFFSTSMGAYTFFHFRRTAFSSMLKSRVSSSHILAHRIHKLLVY